MKVIQAQQGIVAKLKSIRPAKRPSVDAATRKNAQPLAGQFDNIDALDANLFAESFLKNPLAKAMLKRGEALKFFLPVQRSDCAEWAGVDITIAGVTKEWLIGELERSAASRRGGSRISSPHGLLEPGDYGVHSHPDTAKLMKNRPRGA